MNGCSGGVSNAFSSASFDRLRTGMADGLERNAWCSEGRVVCNFIFVVEIHCAFGGARVSALLEIVKMTTPRLDEIEVKVSMIEDSMDELNHAVFRLQQQAGQLQEQLRFLYRKLQALTETSAASQDPRDDIPPHY